MLLLSLSVGSLLSAVGVNAVAARMTVEKRVAAREYYSNGEQK